MGTVPENPSASELVDVREMVQRLKVDYHEWLEACQRQPEHDICEACSMASFEKEIIATLEEANRQRAAAEKDRDEAVAFALKVSNIEWIKDIKARAEAAEEQANALREALEDAKTALNVSLHYAMATDESKTRPEARVEALAGCELVYRKVCDALGIVEEFVVTPEIASALAAASPQDETP